MPKISSWPELPPALCQHLMQRMRDRAISVSDLNQLRLWIEAQPEVLEGAWFKDFGSFKICGHGKLPKLSFQRAKPLKASHFKHGRGEGRNVHLPPTKNFRTCS